MESLIKGCKMQDKEAMHQLYEQYKLKVYRSSLLITHNRALAEDITQEAFIRVFEKIRLYNETYSFEAWLYKVVVNVARNTLRKNKWETLLSPFAQEQEGEDLSRPQEDFEKKEKEQLLQSVIEDLPYKQQEVIVLKYYNCFSQEEISQILQIPLGTVKSRINSALKKLRSKLQNNSNLREVFNYE